MTKLQQTKANTSTSQVNLHQVFEQVRDYEVNKKLWEQFAGMEEIIIPTVMQIMGYTNRFQVPIPHKIFVSAGPQPGSTALELVQYLHQLTGQQPVATKVRRNNAKYKVREGMPAGAQVSLTGRAMRNFHYLLLASLADFRDLKALPETMINFTRNSCQLNVGFEHIGFFKQMPYLGTGRKVRITLTIVSKLGTKTKQDIKAWQLVLYLLGYPMKQAIDGKIGGEK
jgi:large subunit ribosomal protein L5